ncbi:DUF2585 family protein [Aquicoccus sp. SCR17]|nr:DUF2585 family protein [Carideicomes alvinocaridis]
MQDSRREIVYLLCVAMFFASSIALWAMGRNLICPCGYVALWHGPNDPGMSSQHLMDWYTPSHLLHGILFFGALWLVARRLPMRWRFAIALAVECTWEVVENTPWVIERYRTTTISDQYNGDSVINSAVDVLVMIAGFWLARRLPVWASVAIVLGFEVLTTWLIRDGLALNILMLLWPMEAVSDWQSAV